MRPRFITQEAERHLAISRRICELRVLGLIVPCFPAVPDNGISGNWDSAQKPLSGKRTFQDLEWQGHQFTSSPGIFRAIPATEATIFSAAARYFASFTQNSGCPSGITAQKNSQPSASDCSIALRSSGE